MTKDRALELANECISDMIKRHMPSPVSHIADAILAAVEEEASRPGEFVYSEETKAKAREMFEDVRVVFKLATGRYYKHGNSDSDDSLYGDMCIPIREMLRRARKQESSDRHGFVGGPFATTCEFCRNGKYTPIHNLNP